MLQRDLPWKRPVTDRCRRQSSFPAAGRRAAATAFEPQLASPPVATRNGLACLLLESAILTHKFCYRAKISTFASDSSRSRNPVFALGYTLKTPVLMIRTLAPNNFPSRLLFGNTSKERKDPKLVLHTRLTFGRSQDPMNFHEQLI